MIKASVQVSTSLRPDHNTNNAAVRSYPKGTEIEGDILFTAPQDLYNGKTRYQIKGDQWLHVTVVQEPGKDKAVVNGWMAIRHMGVSSGYPVITQNDEAPTPSARYIVGAVITYNDGSTERLV